MADRSVKVILSANVSAFQRDMRAAAASVRETYEASTDAEERLRMQSQAMTELGQGALVAGGVIAAGIGVAIMAYANFDEAMSAVQASTMESADNMALLREAAIAAGADTQFSATEAANAIDELAKAGLSTKDILGGGLAGALDLAAAGGLGVARAAEISATTLSQFGLAGEEASHVADVLAAGAGKALGSVDDLANGLKFVGPIAASMGVSIEETTGVLALFAQQGIIGEQAGTSLRGVLASLTSPSKQARQEIERLGLQLYDAQGNFLGLENAAGQLSSAYTSMDGASRDASLGIIFGRETVTAATALYKSGAEGVADWTAAVDDSGFAAAQAQMKMDNLKGDLEALAGSFETFLINTGSGADGPLRGLVQSLDSLVDGMGQLPGPVLELGLGVAALASGVLLLGGAALVIVPQVGATVTALGTLGLTAGTATGALALLRTGLVALAANPIALGLAAVAAGMWAISEGAKAASDSAAEVQANIIGAADAQSIFEAGSKRKEGILDGLGIEADSKGLKQLQDLPSVLGPAREMLDNFWAGAKYMGEFDKSLAILKETGKTLSEMDAGQAAAQFQILADATDGTTEQMYTLIEALGPEYKDALLSQANAAGVVIGDLSTLEGQQSLVNYAMGDGVTASGEYAGALADGASEAEAQAEALQELQDAIYAAADAMQSLIRDENAYYEQLSKTSEIIAENGQTLDVTTESGRANRAALADLAQTATDVAKSMIETGDSAEEVNGHLASSRQEFLTAAEAAGLMGAEAETLADQLGLVPQITPLNIEDNGTIPQANDEVIALLDELLALPPNTDVHTTALTDQAKARLEELGIKVTTLPDGTVIANADTATATAALDQAAKDRYSTIYVAYQGYQGGSDSSGANNNNIKVARGGLFEGNIQKFANGGFPLPAGMVQPGIYKGGADIRHFAEPETRWEAYISGKPGMEARNLRIWEEAGRRLGKEIVSLGGNQVAAFADGGMVRNGGGDVRAAQFATQAARSMSTSIITDNSRTIAPTIPGANQDIGLLVDKVVLAIRREDRWQK